MTRTLSPEMLHILEAGNSAPSGENCQPWHFYVRDKEIEIHLVPERDQSAYNWEQRASYLACGAVVENMVIAASAEHFKAMTRYFPDSSNEWHVATLTFIEDTITAAHPLAPYVSKRITNRKPYMIEPLSQLERESLLSAASMTAEGTFSLIEDRDAVTSLGRVGAVNEEVMLANPALHRFFFTHINWTPKEDNQKKSGFYIKTLELPPPAQVLFKLFRHWSVMHLLVRLGFNRAVAKQNTVTNAAASAMGVFNIRDTEPFSFVKLGQAVERVWLTATSLGLSLQPLTGVLFLKLRIDEEERTELFSPREQDLISTAYAQASRILESGNSSIMFLCRIGRAEEPTAHAARFPLSDTVTIIS